ncbi:MAG TPA: precorrin-6Y C5,15-methyltransferase (decarboxylating) subunit CbiT [Trebonia sp.]|jgi:precorrin-6Y C5,15-methyltransferase (decarboxylating)
MSGTSPPSPANDGTGPRARIQVVGVGADGWDGLIPRAREIVLSAAVVLGGARHLALLPPVPGQRREPWPAPLRAGLPALLASVGGGSAGSEPAGGGPRGSRVVALASGDPMLSGIGTTLIELLGAEAVSVIPAVSSVALARAELGWAAESCAVVSVTREDPSSVLRELAPGRRVLVLSADERTPGQVAGLLAAAGYGDSVMTVLGDLGSDQASRVSATAESWRAPARQAGISRLNIIALELAGPRAGGWVAGLPDDAFEHDGQLTKRDLRASALARLAPAPGERLWDVGAGAGSVGIEWMRAHPACTATAVEANAERAARIARNAARLGVPRLEVVTGRAPEALEGLPAPDAVFIGGGATRDGVLDTCLSALRHGGRLVVHGVTLETERLLADAYTRHGGELTRIALETAAPIGSFTGWSPARTVTQWSFTR